MNKKQILEWFYTNSTNLTAANICVIMVAALCIAVVIYVTYWFTFRGIIYNARMNAGNVIILLVSTVIMLMISSNIVISLGMVGALSIVRFRTAIKDPKDTIYLFWSVVEGLCVGSQNFKLAFITTFFIAIVLFFFNGVLFQQQKYMIILCGDDVRIDLDKVKEIFREGKMLYEIQNFEATVSQQRIMIEVKTRNKIDESLSRNLMAVKGITAINWVPETGEVNA